MIKEKLLRLCILCICFAAAVILYLQNSLLRQGGWAVIPVLFCSLLGFTIIFGKVKQFFDIRLDAVSFMRQIFEKIERQRIKEAIDLCGHADVPLTRVLRAGIIKYDRSRDEIKEAMDNALRYEKPSFEQNLPLLSALLDVLPLLGFLGTFAGTAEIFQVLQAKEAVSLSAGLADVAGGVWRMLLPPLLALVTLIPLYMGYRFLTVHAKALEDDIETSSRELLSFLLERRMQS